jgi:hypothetical protein
MITSLLKNLLRFNSKKILGIIGVTGVLILMIPVIPLEGNRFSFFSLYLLRTLCCWIVGLMIFLLFIQQKNNINVSFKKVQQFSLLLFAGIFFFSPLLYLYFVLRNT